MIKLENVTNQEFQVVYDYLVNKAQSEGKYYVIFDYFILPLIYDMVQRKRNER